jgi:hypothetical protein
MQRPDIDAIEARANAAQPGPWSAQDRWPILVDANGHAVGDAAATGPNGEFIATSRTDVPELCAYIRHLEGQQQEREDEAFARGEQSVWRKLLSDVLGGLKDTLPMEHLNEGWWRAERVDALHALRDLCEEYSLSNGWPDNLRLADIISKHVGRSLR